jgi:hypothetical protein
MKSDLSELERLIIHNPNGMDRSKKRKNQGDITNAKIFGKPKHHTLNDVIIACQASHPSVF